MLTIQLPCLRVWRASFSAEVQHGTFELEQDFGSDPKRSGKRRLSKTVQRQTSTLTFFEQDEHADLHTVDGKRHWSLWMTNG
ncbi:MAG: hypothetical protein ACLU9S_16260 [Oscillospiraceae bacterium]